MNLSPGRVFGRTGTIALIALVSLAATACGSDTDIDATIDARIQAAFAAEPTLTPQPTATLQPTVTPAPEPTVLPTSTPAPTATPAPAPTPLPTATPQPTVTPQPTATSPPPPEPTPTAIPVPSDLYSELRLSVVKISTGDAFGSGWAISEGWIITNEHVINGQSVVSVEIPQADGSVEIKSGTVRAFDTKRDLAAIEVDHGAPVLPLRIVTASDAGTPIMQMGYSVNATGGFPVVHVGVITTVVRHLGDAGNTAPERADLGGDTDGVGIVIFDADADPGDSGGPLLDLNGNVVGITFGTVISTGGGKRVIGQQLATGIESINRVWTDLQNGTNTSGT